MNAAEKMARSIIRSSLRHGMTAAPPPSEHWENPVTDEERARQIVDDADRNDYIPESIRRALREHIAIALAAERERCAEAVLRMGGSVNDGFTLEDCAAAIRALGESHDRRRAGSINT